jgi:hypothetical protein
MKTKLTIIADGNCTSIEKLPPMDAVFWLKTLLNKNGFDLRFSAHYFLRFN